MKLSQKQRKNREVGTECVAMREGDPWHAREVQVTMKLPGGMRLVKLLRRFFPHAGGARRTFHKKELW